MNEIEFSTKSFLATESSTTTQNQLQPEVGYSHAMPNQQSMAKFHSFSAHKFYYIEICGDGNYLNACHHCCCAYRYLFIASAQQHDLQQRCNGTARRRYKRHTVDWTKQICKVAIWIISNHYSENTVSGECIIAEHLKLKQKAQRTFRPASFTVNGSCICVSRVCRWNRSHLYEKSVSFTKRQVSI